MTGQPGYYARTAAGVPRRARGGFARQRDPDTEEKSMIDIVMAMGMIVGIAATTAITLTLLALAMNWVGR